MENQKIMNTKPYIFTIFTCKGAKTLEEDVFHTHFVIAATSAEAEEKFRAQVKKDRAHFMGQERAFVQTDGNIQDVIDYGLECELETKSFVNKEDRVMTQQQIDMWIRTFCRPHVTGGETIPAVYREILI